MLSLRWWGEDLTLLPEGAVHRPAAAELITADLHLGKSAAFRTAGIPVPAAVTSENLARLDRVIERVNATRLIVLGDMLHAKQGRTPDVLDAFAAWRDARPDLEIVLVRGNHDVRAGDPPARWRVRCVDEPWPHPPFALCHIADNAPEHVPCLAGHVHPAIVIRGGDGFRARRPCFWFGRQRAVLPAFGAFTGAHSVRPDPGDRVFAIDGVQEVIEVTALVGQRG